MSNVLISAIENYFLSLFKKIAKDPLKNIAIILVSLMIIWFMAQAIVPFGIFTTISYVIACLYGFSKIIDNPNRPLIWGVGFVIGSQAIKLITTSFLPMIKEGTSVSILSGLVILYVIVTLYIKAYRLKKE
jgi:hypothetical protein